MIRVVLVEEPGGGWALHRQERWMAEVRKDPGIAGRPRLHLDLPEATGPALLGSWDRPGKDEALARLHGAGAIEVDLRSDRD